MPQSDSRLTIVIPTFRRPQKARRALEFWAGSGFDVLMLDGSESPMAMPATAQADPCITYLHMPVPLAQRFGHAADQVRTPYVTLCGDDEFLLSSALEASLRFLDTSADHVACGGQALAFDRGALGGLRAFPRYPRFRGLDIAGGAPGDRALRHFATYSPAAIYAVCRADAWGAGARLWSAPEFPVYAIGELQFEFFMAYLGGIRRLPVLHWLRSYERAGRVHQRSGGGDVSLSRALQIAQVWADPVHAALRAAIVRHTSEAVAAASGQAVGRVAADFEAAVSAYLDDQRNGQDAGTRLQRRLARLRLPLWLRLRQLRAQGIACDAEDVAAASAAVLRG